MISSPRTRKSWRRTFWHRLVRLWRGVVHLEDSPQRIAIGSGVGTFFSFQPLALGGQMAWGALATKLLRGNVLASLPWAWITNPFTAAPIYYGCYRLGRLVAPVGADLGFADLQAIAARFEELGWWESAKQGWSLIVDIVVPLQVGSALVGLVFGLAVYAAVLRGTAWAQRRRAQRRSRWHGTTASGRGEPPPLGDVERP